MSDTDMPSPLLLPYERLVKLCEAMTEEERRALHEWEQSNLTGDGKCSTSDCPGWKNVCRRLLH